MKQSPYGENPGRSLGRSRIVWVVAGAIGVVIGATAFAVASNTLRQASPSPSGPEAAAIEAPAPTPPSRTRFSAGGRSFSVWQSIAKDVDLSRAELVATDVNARSYVVAPSADGTEVCFLEIPDVRAEEDSVLGCDSADALRSKGGWMISRSTSSGLSGVFILPPGAVATAASATGATTRVDGRAVAFVGLRGAEPTVNVQLADGTDVVARP